jgi:hypothetical protein
LLPFFDDPSVLTCVADVKLQCTVSGGAGGNSSNGSNKAALLTPCSGFNAAIRSLEGACPLLVASITDQRLLRVQQEKCSA